MAFTDEVRAALGWSNKTEDFVIGTDSFSDLEISSAPAIEQFYYFYDKKNRRLIKQFVLDRKSKVDYLCQVTLIKKDSKFTPRIALSIRDKHKKIEEDKAEGHTNIKANVSLADCQENFWKLVRYLQTMQELDFPKDEGFSLVSTSEADIISALKGRGAESVSKIIKALSAEKDVRLSESDINQLLKRREKLISFERGLEKRVADESKWQDFFEKNKWIFGYGLNYQILRQEQSQPHYGGGKVDGQGGQRGDYLTSTLGEMNFTVLVEIKTPETPLLQGKEEIRNGAWSLSKELTDAISQIEANIHTWERDGSQQVDNKDDMESRKVFTVKPKGIVVIGTLAQLDSRTKRETFQRFRQSIHGVEIITFDELYHRAKFIVESHEEADGATV